MLSRQSDNRGTGRRTSPFDSKKEILLTLANAPSAIPEFVTLLGFEIPATDDTTSSSPPAQQKRDCTTTLTCHRARFAMPTSTITEHRFPTNERPERLAWDGARRQRALASRERQRVTAHNNSERTRWASNRRRQKRHRKADRKRHLSSDEPGND